ncbi:MAG: ABC transporter permease subunit [candidate division Zixibacteria bacterium]|nr:ABC transporter permease subunit [candidate division Zixibacteria bacterium]
MTFWLVAGEFFKRSFSPRMLVALGVVGFLFLVVAGCLFGARLYSGGRVYGAEEQAALALGASYHIAVAWGILFAVMLAMGAASRPLEDGRAAFLLSKPVRRSHVLLGQLLGVFLAALAAAAALALLASALSLVRAHVLPWTLWLGLAVASLSLALVVALVAFFSLFLPRVVAGMLGIIFYVASFPAAFSTVRDFMTGGHGAAALEFPWYVRWGAEVYFAGVPPVAGVQLRAGELLKLQRWDVDGWLTVATAAAYVVLLFVATWALYNRRDV